MIMYPNLYLPDTLVATSLGTPVSDYTKTSYTARDPENPEIFGTRRKIGCGLPRYYIYIYMDSIRIVVLE
jgi:hypothetical protein